VERIAIIHLVWHGAGLGAFKRFIDSYRRYRAGVAHTLVLVLKEIPAAAEPLYDEVIGDLPHVRIRMPLPCMDIPAYLDVANALPSDEVCLLNSNSEILADDWLAKLAMVNASPLVGAVSATGSWESHLNATLDTWRQNAAHGDFLPWDHVRQETEALASLFSPFPNYHLRTNALMIRRSRLVDLPFAWDSRGRLECLVFESGWMGLTHQLAAQGLIPVVVGRDGRAYEKEHWPLSQTFRSGEQQNLLVGDNRTRDYLDADQPTRRMLSYLAWGQA
jgi:hypothetical protein